MLAYLLKLFHHHVRGRGMTIDSSYSYSIASLLLLLLPYIMLFSPQVGWIPRGEQSLNAQPTSMISICNCELYTIKKMMVSVVCISGSVL